MNPINQFVQIVLVETSHPGNIGSVARAMKNMGLANLSLINPKKFPHQDATALAGNATDILGNAQIFDSIEEAANHLKSYMQPLPEKEALSGQSYLQRKHHKKSINLPMKRSMFLFYLVERIGGSPMKNSKWLINI